MIKVGDMVKFRFIYNGCSLNGKKAVYLGEDFIHRKDGVTIRNHRVLEVGASKTTCIDNNLLKYMEKCNED